MGVNITPRLPAAGWPPALQGALLHSQGEKWLGFCLLFGQRWEHSADPRGSLDGGSCSTRSTLTWGSRAPSLPAPECRLVWTDSPVGAAAPSPRPLVAASLPLCPLSDIVPCLQQPAAASRGLSVVSTLGSGS